MWAAGAGIAVGGLLGVLTAPDGTAGTLARDAVPVYACPGDTEVGTLYRGDRVLVIGRSGDWLAVRNVRGAGERVFVLAATIIPDADLSALPEVDCDAVGTVAFDETTTEPDTTTTTGGDETTTTTSGSPTTTAPGATTTVPAVTTTTAAVTTTTAPPPMVGAVSANPVSIWEAFPGDTQNCSGQPGRPIRSTISAGISAPAGIQTVGFSWTSGSFSGGGSMGPSGGGNYSGTLGPFRNNEINVVPDGGLPVQVTVVVTVTDSLNRQATGQTLVTLNDCSFG